MSTIQTQPGSTGAPALSIAFDHVLEREPLAIACMQALTKDGEPGSGIKLLRLVSKQANRAMQKHIRGFTLLLDGVTAEVPNISMLNLAQLSRLTVLVTLDPRRNSIGLNHMRQMQRFIMTSRAALQSIKSMDLALKTDRYFYSGMFSPSEFDIAAVLVSLAHICSSVQQLRISGYIGEPLLAAFGSACLQLTSLETVDVPSSTSEKLNELLPRVISVCMTLSPCESQEHYDFNHPSSQRLALSNCSTLTQLNIGGDDMTGEMWRALPPSIQKLHIGAEEYNLDGAWDFPLRDEEGSLPAGQHLPNLQEVVFKDWLIHLSKLARMLRAAPKLQRLGTYDVWVPARLDQIPDLVLVNQRLAAGLVVDKSYRHRHPHRKEAEGLVLQLKDISDTLPDSFASRFLSSLPVLEYLVNVKVGNPEPPQAALLARAFPKLRTLSIFYLHEVEGELYSSSFPCLALFTSLETLSLCCAYSAAELGALCLKIPSLQFLNGGVIGTERTKLIEVLDTWGSSVVVSEC